MPQATNLILYADDSYTLCTNINALLKLKRYSKKNLKIYVTGLLITNQNFILVMKKLNQKTKNNDKVNFFSQVSEGLKIFVN